MTGGTWVLGVLNGLTIGLLAVGLVLVYKSSRFLNLAHAQMGTIPALLVGKWVLDKHWNWWLAFALAIVLGILTALVIERLFVRPMMNRTRSPIRLLLLSLAVSQLLLALTYVSWLKPSTSDTGEYPQPFHSSVSIGGVVLTGMNILTAILVPILVIALALFMRYSLMGKQIRAAANNPDAARLCGIPIRRVTAVTWAMAGACSVIAGVILAPGQASAQYASFGPLLLVLTLGAAALGAFVSLPLALVGGLVLGLVNQLVAAHYSNGTDAELAVFLVILAIIFIRGGAIGRVFDLAGTITEERTIIRMPAVLRATAFGRYYRLVIGLVVAALLLVWPHLPYFDTTGHEFLLTLILIYAMLGVALTMLLGWGGQVSLGQFAIVGMGAYLTARWQEHGLSLPILCLVIGLVGAATLAIIGLPALRVRGLTLAVTTLGFAVITQDWLLRQSWFGSSQAFGLTVNTPRVARGLRSPTSEIGIYYVALVVLGLLFVAAMLLRDSGPGRIMLAVRDNERGSQAFGIAPESVKLALLAVSGFVAGVAGVLWANTWQQVSPDQFGAEVSIAIVAIPVIGGLGSLGGALAAAVTLYAGTFFIGPHLSFIFGNLGNNIGFSLFIAGLAQIGILIGSPTGIAGASQNIWQGYLDRRAERLEAAGRGAEPAEPAHALARADYGTPPNRTPAVKSVDADALPLQISGIRVRFGGIVAVDSPDIEVRPGEIVGLIGTNGAGKTTLMNVISGLQTPAQGSIRIFGEEVVDLPADIRAAGFGLSRSFQDATLFGSLTVTESVQVPLSRRHKVGIVPAMLGAPWVRDSEARTREQASDIVERFGLHSWADTRTSELSTGTRRICDLAAQVASSPKLLLLDEPTAGVAQREAEAFGPRLRKIREELDCSILIVEHDMPLLMGLCDRIYALEAGMVIAEGTPEEIRSNPRVIASYLGTEDAAIARSGDTEPGVTQAAPATESHVEEQ
ncbi:MAG TPA: ATP-binding cassette domain-containing protein [Mycobacteriales bacterium]|nr:ATP-binding cassette domain-containing protein [Mycobacteriales bacterium]